MMRTCKRPLPTGAVSPAAALGYAGTTAAAGVGVLAAATNPVTAALGAANIALYAGPYTLLKPVSEWNTWVGALVGAIPPLMGWTAAGGSVLDAAPLLLGSVCFLWQFPHFFSLAWVHRRDYARGGFKMVPCADPTGARTADLVWRYSWCVRCCCCRCCDAKYPPRRSPRPHPGT